MSSSRQRDHGSFGYYVAFVRSTLSLFTPGILRHAMQHGTFTYRGSYPLLCLRSLAKVFPLLVLVWEEEQLVISPALRPRAVPVEPSLPRRLLFHPSLVKEVSTAYVRPLSRTVFDNHTSNDITTASSIHHSPPRRQLLLYLYRHASTWASNAARKDFGGKPTLFRYGPIVLTLRSGPSGDVTSL